MQTLLDRRALLALVFLAPLCCARSHGDLHDGAMIPRDPKRGLRVRIPHQAFQSWARTPQVESWLNGGMAKKPRVMDAVNKFRAKICFQMKDQHGEKFNSFTACKEFMEQACRPGGDLMMDGDKKEVSSGKGYCAEYFPQSEDEAEKMMKEGEDEDVVDEDAEKAALDKAAADKAAADKAAADKAAADKAAAEKAAADKAAADKAAKDKAAGAKGGAAGAAPGPSPAGGPAAYPADEAWYYKSGGKDAARFHMNETMKLPAQGYHGPLVEHDDMQTFAGDWRAEFGSSDPKTLAAVCKEHPENAWCHKKGYKPPASHHSASSALVSSAALLLLLAATTSAF